jgi:methyl-accepting chemotaxis protein
LYIALSLTRPEPRYAGALSIQQRFRLLLVVSLACFALCGAIVYRTLAEIRVNGPIYERIMQGQDLVADIPPPPAYLVESYLIALQLMDADPVHAPLLQRLQAAQQTYQQRYQYWQRQGLSGEPGAALPDAIACAGAVVYQTAFGQLVPALRDGEELQARRALARLGTVYEQQRAVIERVVERRASAMPTTSAARANRCSGWRGRWCWCLR